MAQWPLLAQAALREAASLNVLSKPLDSPLLLQGDLTSQQVVPVGAWDPTPSRLDRAIPFLPAVFLVAYTLLSLASRYLIPRFIKEKLAFLTRDPVTIDDIPDAEPVSRRLPLRKIVVNIVTCFARLGVEIYLLVETCLSRNRTSKVEVVLYSCYVALWTFITIHAVFARKPTPYYGLVFFYLFDIFAIWANRLTVVRYESPLATYLDILFRFGRLLPSLTLLWVSLTLPMSPFLPTPKTAVQGFTVTRSLDSPEDGTTLLSWLLVDWMNPLLSLAKQRTLQDEDIWQLSPYFQHAIIYPVYKKMKISDFMWRMYAFCAFDIIIGSICSLAIAILTFAGPFFLNKILSALESDESELRTTAYRLAFLAFVFNIIKAGIDLFRQWHGRRAYERCRGILIMMVFDKATRRKDTSGSVGHRKADKDEEDVAGSDAGGILNMMSGDAYSVAQWIWDGIPAVAKAPMELVVATVFLYQILGWSALVGLSTILISYIMIHALAKRNLALTRALMSATDRRISVIGELVSAIRFLKYYAWEKIWVDKAIAARERELSVRYRSNINSALLTLVFLITPSMITFATFWCFTKVAKQELTIPVALPAMATFQMVQQPLFELPGKIFFFLRTRVSVRRLERFLSEEDLDEVPSVATEHAHQDNASANDNLNGNGHRSKETERLAFIDSTHIYPQQQVRDETVEPFTLSCSDITFPKGKLTIVYGDNASGKTSLLMACIGEMDCTSGSMTRPLSKYSYAIATQDAWLEQATIRDNVLFGAPYDEERFEQVMEACALSFDLARWEAREYTEIGERGISLSGGQKARIALARAVYSRAPYVLLDDPLSAVDAHTARHLVVNCFSGPLMKHRTCILVTHHVRLCLPVAAMAIKMTDGRAEIQEIDETDLTDLPELAEVDEGFTTQAITSKEQTPGNMTPMPGALITKEHRETGSVKWIVYKMYLHAAGLETWAGILTMLVAARGMSVVQTWFIKVWGESYRGGGVKWLPSASEDINPWLGVYISLTLVTAAIYLTRLGFSYHGSFKAARKLLYACLLRVTSAPSRWLDENPTGRLLNRFTADIGSVDSTMNNSVTDVCNDLIGTVISLGAVLIVVPKFVIFAAVAIVLYTFLLMPYVRCSRDLRRLENNHRSPLFSRFGGLLKGLKIVRAFGQEPRYMKLLASDLDLFQSMDHFFWTARMYLSLRLDLVGALSLYVVTLVGLAGGVGQGAAGFAIVLTQQFVTALHAACWSYAKLELDINSIERIHDLMTIPQEPAAVVKDKRPPAYWPHEGEIIIEDLAIRYAPHLPLVLKGVSVMIKPGEKVGIVGRTGSGKTTLALSLLRINEAAAGSIVIDGIDISKIGLHDLRERITIISQEAVLFEGTIRSNLDPNNQHSDLELWDVLRRVGMANVEDEEGESARYINKLDAPVTAGAENFSQGEKQLLSIARALLRRTKVFIADEATASVDFDSDEMVQHTLRRELHDATVITIAHRLRTVIDVDKVIVMSEGTIVEEGAPKDLLADPDSAFTELCRQSNELEQLTYLASLE